MIKWINILFLILISFIARGQNNDSVNQNIGLRYFDLEPKRLYSLDSIPKIIKEISLDFLKFRLADYYSKIEFINGQIFNTDTIQNKLNELKIRNRFIQPIPYYDLNFALIDTSIGINKLWINIELDKFGQLIDCNFPILEPKSKIISIESAKIFSDSIINTKYPEIKSDNYKIELNFDKKEQQLEWIICYLRREERNEKDYICLYINALRIELIKEWGMVDMYDEICCPEGIKIELNPE
jgi:hypothetical protein